MIILLPRPQENGFTRKRLFQANLRFRLPPGEVVHVCTALADPVAGSVRPFKTEEFGQLGLEPLRIGFHIFLGKNLPFNNLAAGVPDIAFNKCIEKDPRLKKIQFSPSENTGFTPFFPMSHFI